MRKNLEYFLLRCDDMCLILFAYKVHEKYPLIVAANRDEFFKRPTAQAHFWEDEPNILAGRDLEKLGTWMGVTKQGRFAAITNYRSPEEMNATGKRSRGELVKKALTFEGEITQYMQGLEKTKEQYPGYNLLVGNHEQLFYFSNKNGSVKKLEPGIYGLSNHLLNTPWPKVTTGKYELKETIVSGEEDLIKRLFELLQKADPFPDELLPNTGVPLELERMLSPLYISSNDYGTRSSTVLLLGKDEIQYIEKVMQPEELEALEFKFNY